MMDNGHQHVFDMSDGKSSGAVVPDEVETLHIPPQPRILIKNKTERGESRDVRQEETAEQQVVCDSVPMFTGKHDGLDVSNEGQSSFDSQSEHTFVAV